MANNKLSQKLDTIDGKFYDYATLKIKNNEGLSPDLINKRISKIINTQKVFSKNSSKIYLGGKDLQKNKQKCSKKIE